MYQIDGDRSFANSGGHPLYVSGADVAHGEDTWQAGFEHLWRAGKRPFEVLCDRIQSRPVRMKPLLSSITHPLSHSLRGEAPVIMNTWRISRVEVSPLFLSCQVTRSNCASPSRPTISV